MAKKVLLQDQYNNEILPITRGELILDSSGNMAFHSNEFLATNSLPGLLSAEDKFKIDTIEEIGNIANNKVEQINTTTSDIYRLLFSETADDETRTEGARKSAKLTFNPSTGVLQASELIGNIDGTYINKLTGYTKATLSSDITPEDTLISALGKVELRAEIAYNLIQGAYDGDGTIENLNEILKVLEGISDTEPIKDIIGKYLPLSGGTLVLEDISSFSVKRNKGAGYGAYIQYENSEGILGHLGLYKGSDDAYVADIYFGDGSNHHLIHSGNIDDHNLTILTKTLTVTKDWMDTGIKYTDLTTGTYAIQVYSHATNNLIWDSYWSGIMTWYGGGTNSSESDEILLHRGAHAYNGNTIYLRTINTASSDGRHMRLQIAANKNFSSATYTFKFKKLI